VSAPAHLAAGEAHLLLAYLPAGHRAALAHALACTPCRQLLSDILQSLIALAAEATAAGAGVPAELAAMAAVLAAEYDAAEPLVGELLAAPAGERRRLLLDRAVAAIDGAPRQAEGLARLALRIAARLGHMEGRAIQRAIVEARGWAVVANVRWKRGDWPGVRLALERTDEALVRTRLEAASPGVRDLLAAVRLSEQQIADDFALAAHAVRALLQDLRAATAIAPSPASQPT
jgi:hypothetical protein